MYSPSFSELATYATIGIFVSMVASKIHDAFKSKDVRTAIMNVMQSKGALSIAKNYIKALDVMIDTVIPGNFLFKRLTLTLNSSLILSMALIVQQATEDPNEKKRSTTIVGMMLGEKLKKSSRTQFFLIIALLTNISLDLFFGFPHSGTIFFIVGLGLFAIHADHKLIEHRIRNGWYGKNEFESREIIEFIISHANKDDFNDSGGLKKIIPTPEFSEEKHKEIATGVTA